jgi:hypothetical protein
MLRISIRQATKLRECRWESQEEEEQEQENKASGRESDGVREIRESQRERAS